MPFTYVGRKHVYHKTSKDALKYAYDYMKKHPSSKGIDVSEPNSFVAYGNVDGKKTIYLNKGYNNVCLLNPDGTQGKKLYGKWVNGAYGTRFVMSSKKTVTKTRTTTKKPATVTKKTVTKPVQKTQPKVESEVQPKPKKRLRDRLKGGLSNAVETGIITIGNAF